MRKTFSSGEPYFKQGIFYWFTKEILTKDISPPYTLVGHVQRAEKPVFYKHGTKN